MRTLAGWRQVRAGLLVSRNWRHCGDRMAPLWLR